MVKLRMADENDCLVLWEWANDPQVRQAAFDPEVIPLESHKQWFISKLSDPNCYIYILENDDSQPVGQVRLDLQEDGKGMVDFSVISTQRGQGYGSLGLQEASRKFFKQHPGARIVGLVKEDNTASLRAFERAGFHKDAVTTEASGTVVSMALLLADMEEA